MSRDTEKRETNSKQVLVMAGSARSGSINKSLAKLIARQLEHDGKAVGIIDLAEYEMPLYHGDFENQHGAPRSATTLAKLLADAQALVVVTPEYNGTFTPLLKNTIDWITRADVKALAHLRVLVASASPGSGGGAKAAAMVQTWLGHMGVDVVERTMSVGSAASIDGILTNVDADELASFAAQVDQSVPSCHPDL